MRVVVYSLILIFVVCIAIVLPTGKTPWSHCQNIDDTNVVSYHRILPNVSSKSIYLQEEEFQHFPLVDLQFPTLGDSEQCKNSIKRALNEEYSPSNTGTNLTRESPNVCSSYQSLMENALCGDVHHLSRDLLMGLKHSPVDLLLFRSRVEKYSIGKTIYFTVLQVDVRDRPTLDHIRSMAHSYKSLYHKNPLIFCNDYTTWLALREIKVKCFMDITPTVHMRTVGGSHAESRVSILKYIYAQFILRFGYIPVYYHYTILWNDKLKLPSADKISVDIAVNLRKANEESTNDPNAAELYCFASASRMPITSKLWSFYPTQFSQRFLQFMVDACLSFPNWWDEDLFGYASKHFSLLGMRTGTVSK